MSAMRPACLASSSSAAGALSSKPSLTERSVLRARAASRANAPTFQTRTSPRSSGATQPYVL